MMHWFLRGLRFEREPIPDRLSWDCDYYVVGKLTSRWYGLRIPNWLAKRCVPSNERT